MATPLDELVSISEIARRAGVRPSAVSNWRKRRLGFPDAVERASGSDLFRWGEVAAWLDARRGHPRAQAPLPGISRAEHVGGREELALACALLGLYAVASADELGDLERRVGSDRLDSDVGRDIAALAAEIQGQRPELEDVFVSLIDAEPSETGRLLRELDIPRSPDRSDLASRFEALLTSRDRARLDPSVGAKTAPSLAELVVRLVDITASDSLFDPAAGEAGFLLAAAGIANAKDPTRRITLTGQENDLATWRLAKQRMLVHDLDADLRPGDSLTTNKFPNLQVGAVVCDPPYTLRVPPDTWSPTDLRWRFGMPPNVSDLAWVQLAVHHLRPNGRACVILPAASLFRPGLEARIRVELLQSHVIEAIISLPPNTATSSSVPVALWVLRSPDSGPRRVLLVDAAQPPNGGPGRHDQSGMPGGIDPELSDRILRCIAEWRDDPLKFAARPGFAAPVEIATLLEAGGEIVPARWTRSAGATDPSGTINDLHRGSEELDALRSQLASLPRLQLPLTAREDPPPRVRLRELIAAGDVELIAGIRARSAVPSNAPTTRPGDIVVKPGPRGLGARVDEAGGNTIAAPLQVVRVKADWLDPHVVAAFIGSSENLRLATGSDARVNVRDIEIPRLDLETTKFLRETLARIDEERRLADRASRRVQDLRDSLIAAFARGIVAPDPGLPRW